MSDMDKREHVRILEGWMKSYRPEELLTRVRDRLRAVKANPVSV